MFNKTTTLGVVAASVTLLGTITLSARAAEPPVKTTPPGPTVTVSVEPTRPPVKTTPPGPTVTVSVEPTRPPTPAP